MNQFTTNSSFQVSENFRYTLYSVCCSTKLNFKRLYMKLQNPFFIMFNHVFLSFIEHSQQHQNLLKAEEDLHFCDLLQSLLTLKFLPWKILAKRSRTSKITMHQLMTLTRINPKVRNVFYQLNDHYSHWYSIRSNL